MLHRSVRGKTFTVTSGKKPQSLKISERKLRRPKDYILLDLIAGIKFGDDYKPRSSSVWFFSHTRWWWSVIQHITRLKCNRLEGQNVPADEIEASFHFQKKIYSFWFTQLLYSTKITDIVNRLFVGLCPSSLLRIKFKYKIYKIYFSEDGSSSVFRPTQVDPVDWASLNQGPVIDTSSINRIHLSRS